MPKKYTVSEAALRRLVKQMVSEEIEKQGRPKEESFIEEYPDEPWVYFGEPEQVDERKNVQGAKRQEQFQEFPGWDAPFFPEYEENDTPPFLNRQKKK